jgi:hypothetical protein
MHQVEKEDRFTVLKDSLHENCLEIKTIPTTDVAINFKCLFITKITHDPLFVITQYRKVFSLTF